MNRRNGMLLVAVLAIGLFILPSTLAMFAGQHYFYQTASIPCYKCHQAEYVELDADPLAPHAGQTCQYCHQGTPGNILPGETALGSEYYFNNTTQHAAISIECIACHSRVRTELNDTKESHRDFYIKANETWTTLEGGSESCILCHTHTGVNITFSHWEQLNFTATQDETGAWVLGDLGILNSTSTYSNSSYLWGSSSPSP